MEIIHSKCGEYLDVMWIEGKSYIIIYFYITTLAIKKQN